MLAHRLGQDRGVRILLLEAGGSDGSPKIRIPLTWGLILRDRLFDWGYFTEPEPGMDGRRIECARGKVLGGSSSINGMHYARGAPQDYDHWATDLGLPDWSYERVLPYFKRSESWEDGADHWRGGDGPLTVVTSRFADPLIDAFFDATDRIGYPRNRDYNAETVDGIGRMQMTIRRGFRCSAAVAFLRPALARGNITLQTHAIATRVRFEGSRAVGIEYRHNGDTHVAYAEREVILSGGVINSPHLLMLSGIGDPAQLAQHGIAVKAPLKGVGRNLQDHVVADVRYRRRGRGTLHKLLRLDRLTFDIARNILLGDGLSGSVPASAIGLIRAEPQLALPNAEVILAAGPMNSAPHFAPFLKPYTDAFGIKGLMLQPESRGEITLASASPTDAPLIRQNFLSTEHDIRTMREIIRRMREIAAQPALATFVAEELAPGVGQSSDAAIDAFVRRTAITLHHPAGTCKMGAANDDMAVLDGELRVRGVERLRVVDGSSMPRIVRAPINAPIIMIAEKAADLLRGIQAPPSVPPRSDRQPTAQ